jgi:hypothetical protein
MGESAPYGHTFSNHLRVYLPEMLGLGLHRLGYTGKSTSWVLYLDQRTDRAHLAYLHQPSTTRKPPSPPHLPTSPPTYLLRPLPTIYAPLHSPLPPLTLPLSILNASTTTLDHILEHPSCDVDLQSYLGKETPLHLAVKLEEGGREGLREYLGGLRL